MWLSLLLYFTNKKNNKQKERYIYINNISLIILMIAEENIIRSKLDEIVDNNINIYIYLYFFCMDKCID